MFVLEVDKASGRVISVKTEKSTGQPLLDASAVQAFRQWRCKAGTVSKIKIPVTFTATEDAARY
jgi:TonB family protein